MPKKIPTSLRSVIAEMDNWLYGAGLSNATVREIRNVVKVNYYREKSNNPRGCLGSYDHFTDEFDCDYGAGIACEDCMFFPRNKHTGGIDPELEAIIVWAYPL